MKIISDIRFYKSEKENIDGNSFPSSCCEKSINVSIRRVVMKLRENQFSLGDFDHLYVNFTPCADDGSFCVAKRSVDKNHPWYRFYDVGINPKLFSEIGSSSSFDLVFELTKQLLLKCFSKNEKDDEIILTSFQQAASLGENMLMKYKEKQGAKYCAVVFLRYLDSGEYFPLLCVYDKSQKEVFKTDLPISDNLYALGEIQINSKKVTIKPRKNFFTKDMSPISFEL